MNKLINYTSFILIILFSCKNNDKNLKHEYNHKKDISIDVKNYEELLNSQAFKNNRVVNQCNNVLEYSLFEQIQDEQILKLDTIFAGSDIKFMIKESNSLNNFKLDKNLIGYKNIIIFDSLNLEGNNMQKIIKIESKYECFVIIHKPLFNENGDAVLVEVSLYCGSECGETTKFIYKKINNTWTLFKEYDTITK